MRTRHAVKLLLALVLVSATGCPKWQFVTTTPNFRNVDSPPSGHGVLYVARPTQAMGAQNILTVQVDEQRWFELFPGSYGAFYVPAGKVRVRVGMARQLNFAPSFFSPSAKGSYDDELEVEVPAGGEVYVQTRGVMGLNSAAGKVEPIDAARGPDALRELHLAAGGIPRM